MKKILLSIFLCLPFLLSAQPYTIKHLSIREGLSNNHVVSIAQDKRGSLWFATEEGLNKFDGIRFLTYYKEETTGKQSITGNELNCLESTGSSSRQFSSLPVMLCLPVVSSL